MATDLSTLVGGPPSPGAPLQVFRGRVAFTPVNDRDILRVTVPALTDLEGYEVAPGHWNARGTSLPQAGTGCVVLFDEARDVYVPVFEGPNTYGGAGSVGPAGPAGPAGPTGATGPAGAPGAAGEKWFTQAGAPAAGTGAVGDWSIDSANGNFYEKTAASTWTLRGSLAGPAGATGPAGPTGPTGAPGPMGTVYDSDQIGTVKAFTGKTVPTNWMVADGRTLNRVDYPTLADVLGVAAAAPTFTLPDLRSKFLYGSASATLADLLAAGGTATETLTMAQMPQHSHRADGLGGPGGQTVAGGASVHDHNTQVAFQTNAGAGTTGVFGGIAKNSGTNKGFTQDAAIPDHQHAINAVGSGSPHNNLPPYVLVAHIIKVTGVQVDAGGALVGPPGPPGGGGGHTVQDEGVSLTQRTKLNFTGAGVIATDDAANDQTVVNVPTGSTVPVEAWHLVGAAGEPAFTGSPLWFSHGAGYEPKFRKRPDGVVEIEGMVRGGSGSAFTLPVGYRPDQSLYLPTTRDPGADAFIVIGTDGVVMPGGMTTAQWVTIAARFSAAGALTFPTGPTGPAGPTGGNATVPMDTWHLIGAAGEPAFVSPFIHYDTGTPSPVGSGGSWQLCGFRKDPLGRVYLKGLLGLSGTPAAQQAIFTLPAGYRPPRAVIFYTSNQGTAGTRIDVVASGVVLISSTTGGLGAGSYFTLDDLYFDTESVTQMPTGPTGPAGPAGATGAAGGTMGASVAAQVQGNSTGVELSGAWKNMPIGALVSEPSDAFTVSGGVVTVKDAGWFHVSATLINNINAANTLYLSLSTSATPGDGSIANSASTVVGAGYNRVSTGGSIKLAAGAKIYAHGYSPSAAPVTGTVYEFSIERIGGPIGPAGAPGGTMGAAGLHLGTGTVGVASTPSNYSPALKFGPVVNESPVGSFTRNADDTLSVAEAGWYTLDAYISPNAALAADSEIGAAVYKNGAATTLMSLGEAFYYGRAGVSGTIYLVPTDKIDVRGWSQAAVAAWLYNGLTIARVGGPKGDTGGNATVPMDPWHVVGAAGEPAFQGSPVWGPLDPSSATQRQPRFTKDPLGRVMVTGIAGGGTGSVVFALPVGYRPKRLNEIFVVACNGGTAQVTVDSATGNVQAALLSGTIAWVSFDGVIFDTESVTAMPTGPQGPAGPGVRGLVTALPTLPQDGDECYFQTATMATDGVVWHLRYRAASSSAYKWEFIGGRDLFVSTNASYTYVTGASYVVGPALTVAQLTLPLSGDYVFTATANVQAGSTANAADVRMGLYISGTAVNYGAMSGYSSTLLGANMIEPVKAPARTASEVVDLRIMSNIASTSMSVYDRSLRIEPVRVG
jgi:microcystin-dependent protein